MYAQPIETKSSGPNITWQHVWSFDETRDALLESIFNQIPNEIMLRIFKLLSVPDLCNISLVCRWFKMIADQDDIWKLKCNSEYYIFFSYCVLTAMYSIASKKLYSKSFKQMYIDWIYMKCWRNTQLQTVFEWGRTACVICTPPIYPIRPTGKNRFEIIGGFHQHPNSSSSM